MSYCIVAGIMAFRSFREKEIGPTVLMTLIFSICFACFVYSQENAMITIFLAVLGTLGNIGQINVINKDSPLSKVLFCLIAIIGWAGFCISCHF